MNKKELVIISVIIFMTTVAWVIFEIYQVQNKAILEEQEVPTINVPKEKINVKVIDVLLEKVP